jgi:hypothetical protein
LVAILAADSRQGVCLHPGKLSPVSAMILQLCRLAQNTGHSRNPLIVLEVESRFTESSLHILPGKWLAFFMDEPPQDGAAAIDVPARHHLGDRELWIHPRHDVQHGKKLMLATHGKRYW